MRSGWLKRCCRGVANCRSAITSCWRFPPVAHYSGHFRARRCPSVSGSKRPGFPGRWPASWIWIRLLRFDYSEDSLSPAYNVTAAQSKELATLLTLAERLRVHVSAITPDASALQRFLPFLPSHQQCLAWRDNEQWLWATRYRWGRKLAVGMTSAKELAAALSVDPESVAICGEGGFDPWEAVSVRQPPLPPPGGDFAIALGLALGKAY